MPDKRLNRILPVLLLVGVALAIAATAAARGGAQPVALFCVTFAAAFLGMLLAALVSLRALGAQGERRQERPQRQDVAAAEAAPTVQAAPEGATKATDDADDTPTAEGDTPAPVAGEGDGTPEPPDASPEPEMPLPEDVAPAGGEAQIADLAEPAFDFPAFEQGLVGADDPVSYLRQTVGDIRTREAADEASEGTVASASSFERYLARRLVEAGLLNPQPELPRLGVVMPHRSDTFYIRVYAQSISLAAAMRVLRIESALNSALFAWRHFRESLDDVTMEGLFGFDQALTASICAQMEGSRIGLPPEGDEPDGEWAVRHAISDAIETVQLPHRLTASFRTNVAQGNVAIQVDLTHSFLFPTSAYVEGVGVVSTTSDMRRIAASHYALRLGILLAACAFRSSRRIERVWVAGVIDGPAGHRCYYTVRFDRGEFLRIDLSRVDDPVQVYLDAGANLHIMGPKDGSFTYDGYYVHDRAILLPVQQDFSLEDEQFCPKARYEPVALSSRPLHAEQAEALGTTHVSGLAISEDAERSRVADDIALHLTSSTEKNVRTILDLAGNDADLSVRDAAERTVAKLIAGQLPEDDPLAVREEFAHGDALTQAVLRAQEELESRDFAAVTSRLLAALAPIDGSGAYTDTSTIVYRAFSSYVERALYNRINAQDTRTVLLVPDAYLEAHVMLCLSILGDQGDAQEALAHARRACQVAPLDMRTNLNLIACLELTGDLKAASSQCRDLLRYAYLPQAIAFGYYRMAGLEWSDGQRDSAQACYQRCMRIMPQTAPLVGIELASLVGGDVSQIEDAMSDERIDELLSRRDIPVAPTAEVQRIIREGVQASLDAEVFPVAKSFVNVMGALSGDDVVLGIVRSLEDEPDR